MTHRENFEASSIVSNSPYPVLMDNQGIIGTSHLVNYPSDSCFVELVPKFPSFESASFSEMVDCFGLPEYGRIIGNTGYPPNNERCIANVSQSQEDHELSEQKDAGASLNGRRRKIAAKSSSPFDPNKNVEGEPQQDPSSESCDFPKEHDEKKPKTDPRKGANSRGKQAVKQAKDNSHGGEDPKENYIHVRARRGQATNSHSLAERVRREKISERMRLLQELVPGCSKITGKAVMLDEIINYVQSLQQQVEFLSMKLATVNPELTFDIERILSKDVLHARGSNAASLGFHPSTSSHPYSHGIFQANIPAIPNTNPQFSPVLQPVLENELQSLLQMGFDSSSAIDSLGTINAGRLRPEL